YELATRAAIRRLVERFEQSEATNRLARAMFLDRVRERERLLERECRETARNSGSLRMPLCVIVCGIGDACVVTRVTALLRHETVPPSRPAASSRAVPIVIVYRRADIEADFKC